MIRKILYVSTTKPKLTPEQLESLLEISRLNNKSADITGLLVYSDGNVMQIIEGPKDNVGVLFEKISNDPKHIDVIKLLDIEVDGRNFEKWQMAFVHEPRPTPFEDCVNLIKSQRALLNEARDKGIVGKILSGFIDRI